MFMPQCSHKIFSRIIYFRMCLDDYKIYLGFTIFHISFSPNISFRFPHNFLTLPQSSVTTPLFLSTSQLQTFFYFHSVHTHIHTHTHCVSVSDPIHLLLQLQPPHYIPMTPKSLFSARPRSWALIISRCLLNIFI